MDRNPFLAPARIEALPAKLRDVPDDLAGWTAWRAKVAEWRAVVHEECRTDRGARANAMLLSADDPAWWIAMFGVIFEPRNRPHRKKGWHPWLPFAFQVRHLRWIESVMAVEDEDDPAYLLGRNDGVTEKDRDMGASYDFCGYMANRWLVDDGFVAGCVSKNENLVDNAGDPNTLFFKIEGNLGMDPRVPEKRDGIPVRMPAWMVPDGYDPKQHNMHLRLVHPEKANRIVGETSTMTAGVGGRASLRLNDESAKWPNFADAWSGQSAVTDHRFANSSADNRFGPGFRDLAAGARRAAETGEPGPSYILLDYFDHPEHTEAVFISLQARHADDPAGFRREYRHDYAAAGDTYVYRGLMASLGLVDAAGRSTGAAPIDYDPALPSLLWFDPGILTNTAIHLLQYDGAADEYRLLESYENSGKPAAFYAHIVTGVAPSGRTGWTFGETDFEAMEAFGRAMKGTLTAAGDPFGDHRGADGNTTFYADLNKHVGLLSGGAMTLIVNTNSAHRPLSVRHAAATEVIRRLKVNDAPRCRRTVEALAEHHRKDYGDREVVNPSTEPVRFWGHDRVTAFEWGAAYHRALSSASSWTRTKPTRTNMSGKPYAWGAK